MGKPDKKSPAKLPEVDDELSQDQLDQAAGAGDGSTDSIWIDLGFAVQNGVGSGEAKIDTRTSSRLNNPDRTGE